MDSIEITNSIDSQNRVDMQAVDFVYNDIPRETMQLFHVVSLERHHATYQELA